MDVEIRPLESKEHWPQVQNLLATVPFSTTLPIVVSRPNTLENSYSSFHTKALNFVALFKNRVVGFVHSRVEKRMVWEGNSLHPKLMSYGGDLRITRDFQNRGIAKRLLDQVGSALDESGVYYGFGIIVSNNEPAFKLTLPMDGVFRPVLKYSVKTSLLLRRPTFPKNPSYTRFRPSVVALEQLCESLRTRFLGLAMVSEDLTNFISDHPNIRFYQSTSEPGKIAFALWEQSAFRRVGFAWMPIQFKIIRQAWNTCRSFSKAHEFPPANAPIKTAEVVFVNMSNAVSDFEEIISYTAWKMGCLGVTAIADGLGGNAPSLNLTGLGYKTNLTLMSYGRHKREPYLCPKGISTYIDLGFV